MTDASEKALRLTLTPYIGQLIIIFVTTSFLFFVALFKDAWGLFYMMSVAWAFFALFVYIATRYRIYWTEDHIRRQASGGPDAIIAIKDIAEVIEERATAGEMVAQSAPFRRIRVSDRSGQHINISLRHFRPEDIRELMRWVQKCRPDLTLPKGFEAKAR